MAKPPGRCIFCNGFGLSKEHVLPDWLRAIFPRLPTDTHTMGTVDWVTLPPAVGPVGIPSRKTKQGQAGTRKIRVVCKKCNTGWMHDMEDVTKPILGPLVCGMPRTLEPHDQRILATWIAKTVMTAEYLMPKEVAITYAEREAFRLNPVPRDHWNIWGGYYLGTKMEAGGIFHHGVGIYLPPKPVRIGVKNTQYTVICLGRFLAIALSSEEDGLAFSLNPQLDLALYRLWPPSNQNVAWPLRWGVEDDGLRKILRAMGTFLGLDMPDFD